MFPCGQPRNYPRKRQPTIPISWELGTSLAGGSVFRFGRYAPGNIARWHSTDSVDYAICISGEMWMEMEEGEVHLKPGDVVIQLGTNHNWNNRGTEPCVMAFVLVATEGAKTTGWTEHNEKPKH